MIRPQPDEQVVLAGVDEAGYGPVLGPLVVTAVAFRLPKSVGQGDLWDVLRATVAKRKRSGRKGRGRLVIDDSKKVYRSGKGLSVLERTALGALHAAGHAPASLDALLALLSPDARPERFDPYPWYQDRSTPLPIEADATDVRLAGKAFQRDLQDHGAKLLGIYSEILLAGEFNDRVAKCRNKSMALFELNSRLLARVGRLAGRLPLSLIADKLGGKNHYRPDLMRAFPDAELAILAESKDRSQYRLETPTSRWHVSYAKSADAHHLPVALASIVSKYLRELLMGRLNAYWTARVPDLAPTAGYYEDGNRFLADIAQTESHPNHLLERTR